MMAWLVILLLLLLLNGDARSLVWCLAPFLSYHLIPRGRKNQQKIATNIALGRLRSKQVHYPLLHCLSALVVTYIWGIPLAFCANFETTY